MPTRRHFLGTLAATAAVWPALSPAQEVRSLAARRFSQRIFPDPAPESDVEGLGGFPCPVQRVRLGEPVRLRVENGLDAPLGLHWRGLRGPNAMDGAPLAQKPAEPGAALDIAFTPPDAGVYLYHPAVRSVAGAQMARGLAGLLVVEEKAPPAVDLDLALLLTDWMGPDGKPTALVNGAPGPAIHVLPPGARVRLRIASAATRRMIAAGVDGAKAMVGAVDGQPCTLFEPVRQTLPVAPGARFELFFDLPPEAGAEARFVLRGMSGAPDLGLPLALFQTKGAPLAARGPLERLPDNPLLPERIALEKAKRAEMTIEGGPAAGGWRINGQAADEPAAKPLFSVRRGTPVSLGFVNKSPTPQLMHVHGHVFRNVHLFDDGWDPYWRDSVIVPEGRTVRAAFVADNPGKWLIEGGFSTADGPVSWFEVTG